MWDIPADTIEGVDEHSARLQPSIILHAPVTGLYKFWTSVALYDINVLVLYEYKLSWNSGKITPIIISFM